MLPSLGIVQYPARALNFRFENDPFLAYKLRFYLTFYAYIAYCRVYILFLPIILK